MFGWEEKVWANLGGTCRQEAQTFFGFDAEAVEAAVGNGFTFEGGDVDKFRKAIPANVALGVESCLKKCNIPKNK